MLESTQVIHISIHTCIYLGSHYLLSLLCTILIYAQCLMIYNLGVCLWDLVSISKYYFIMILSLTLCIAMKQRFLNMCYSIFAPSSLVIVSFLFCNCINIVFLIFVYFWFFFLLPSVNELTIFFWGGSSVII